MNDADMLCLDLFVDFVSRLSPTPPHSARASVPGRYVRGHSDGADFVILDEGQVIDSCVIDGLQLVDRQRAIDGAVGLFRIGYSS